jgi:hypothetical protein
LEGNTANTIFQSIYAQTGLTDMTTNLHLIAPVVMG